ncbi:Zinc finger protein 543 [Frankliniella fusca]|uniref:Zinc finger protein 543 n=1 Tax=Frankliniella fusca TaxID=407009 RepID=A0AAE1HNS7_9NEOP|nr:Zinc finger protein 543 [Frankliniella fusca]
MLSVLAAPDVRVRHNEMGSDNVCCPVCRQFIPKAHSLHEHLNTHPKLQVIEALIKLKDACKDYEPSTSVQEKDCSLEDNSTSDGCDKNAVNIAPQFPQPPPQHDVDQGYSDDGSNNPEGPSHVDDAKVDKKLHSSTSVKYAPSSSTSNLSPHFPVSSQAPQFIHVPVVTSAVSKSAQPPPAQAPVVLYKSFVSPPSTSEGTASYSSPLNLAQHLQFLVGNSVVRSPFSIIQTHPSSDPPHNGALAGKSDGFVRNNVIATPCNIKPKLSVKSAEHPSKDWIAPTDSTISLVCSESSVTDSDERSLHGKDPKVLAQPESSRETSVIVPEVSKSHILLGNNCKEPQTLRSDLPVSGLKPASLSPHYQSSQEEGLLSPPRKRRCFPLGSPSRQSPIELHRESSPNRYATGSPVTISNWSALGSPGAHSSSSAEGVLRIASDLNDSVHSVPPTWDENDENWDKKNVKQEVLQTNVRDDMTAPCKTGHMSKDQRITAEENRKTGNAFPSCHEKSSESSSNDVDENNDFEFIIPDVVMESYNDFQDDRSQSADSHPCDSAPPSPYQKSLDSPSTPLNIQTDETMPPRGELSEQESIGGNSSSMWSVPVYHMSRQLPSPVVSYDVTARESWAGSDVSDSEGNPHESDSHHSAFNCAPSFSNTLQPFIPKTSASSHFVGESPFSSHIQPQIYGEGHSTSVNPNTPEFGGSSKVSNNRKTPSENSKMKKGPSKPRVFRCKECSLVFKTLKLRRLHPCEQMKSTSVTSIHVSAEIIGLSGDNTSAPGSSSMEGDNCVSKPKKKNPRKPRSTIKKEVLEDEISEQARFTNQFQISKTEPEDASEFQTNPQASLEIPSAPSQSSEYDPSKTTFVEVPLFKLEESVQTPLRTFGCEKCDQEFKTAKLLSQHMSTKHKDLKYQCTTCGESFDKERNYYDHLMIHPAECLLCGKTFVRRKYLAIHMRWHMDEKPHKCVSCSKSFVTKQKLDEHMNTHTGNAPIKCADCDMTFKRYSNMIQHRNRHHLGLKPKTKDYVCHCGEVLHSKKKLEWHKEIHDMKPKSCHYCAEKFVHTASLTRHVRRAHDSRYVPNKKREGENIECPICHLVFLKASLAGHIKIHGGERPYPCHICGKDFTTKWNLQTHRWTHASRSARQHKCTLCKASFCRRPDYLTHMNTHRNVRPFTCNHCGCQFVRKYNCIRHMRQHEEAKNFACTICNKTFHRNYYLKDHMRIHNGTRPFTCHICGKASTSKSNHNKHVRIHHAREPHNTEL